MIDGTSLEINIANFASKNGFLQETEIDILFRKEEYTKLDGKYFISYEGYFEPYITCGILEIIHEDIDDEEVFYLDYHCKFSLFVKNFETEEQIMETIFKECRKFRILQQQL
jgi:hypothetical protein